MTRSTQGDQFWSTSDTTSGALLMNSDQAAVGWAGGYEIQIGRRTCCGSAWEVTYWNLESLEGDQQVRSFANPGQLSTPLDVGLVTFNGVDASNYFNGAHLHRIERYDSAQNLELNFWQAPVPVRDGRLSVNCLAGVRWMQFNDQLIFGSVSGGGGGGLVPAAANFGDNGGAGAKPISTSTRATTWSAFNWVRMPTSPGFGLEFVLHAARGHLCQLYGSIHARVHWRWLQRTGFAAGSDTDVLPDRSHQDRRGLPDADRRGGEMPLCPALASHDCLPDCRCCRSRAGRFTDPHGAGELRGVSEYRVWRRPGLAGPHAGTGIQLLAILATHSPSVTIDRMSTR